MGYLVEIKVRIASEVRKLCIGQKSHLVILRKEMEVFPKRVRHLCAAPLMFFLSYILHLNDVKVQSIPEQVFSEFLQLS